jgi:hypothetical protein
MGKLLLFLVILVLVGFCISLVTTIVPQVGITLFGSRFEANENVLKETAKAQANISNALLLAYNDSGRLEVRRDQSVHVYIPKKNYMSVPYPDRDAAVDLVRKAWCEDEGINFWNDPVIELRDIQTGEELYSCRCIYGFLHKK